MRKIKWTDTELLFHQNPVSEAMMNIQKNYNKQLEGLKARKIKMKKEVEYFWNNPETYLCIAFDENGNEVGDNQR